MTQKASSMRTFGLDIGSSKTMIVADDAEIVLTSTGSISRPTLVSFMGKNRLIGEEAAAQILQESTIGFLSQLLGKTTEDIMKLQLFRFSKLAFDGEPSSVPLLTVNYCDEPQKFSVPSLFAMFVANEYRRICEVSSLPSDSPSGDSSSSSAVLPRLAFALPPSAAPSVMQAYHDSCAIAGINPDQISLVNEDDAIAAAYGRKLSAIRPADRVALEGKFVVLIEMGHSHSTVVVVKVKAPQCGESVDSEDVEGVEKIATGHDDQLGTVHFDIQLFEHFADTCRTKYSSEVAPDTKRGKRLLAACERIRKLLSQLPEATTTVENITDSGDINLSLRREDLASLSGQLLTRFSELIIGTLQKAGGGIDPAEVGAVEVMGGGARMQIVQQAISAVFGQNTVLGAKFDDGSVALGATIISKKVLASDTMVVETPESGPEAADTPTTVPTSLARSLSAFGLSEDDILSARERERSMQRQDKELQELLASRNELEAYLFELRAAPKRKYGSTIDPIKLSELVDDCENWLYDNAEASMFELRAKDAFLRERAGELCKEYFEAVERDRQQVEAALQEEAQKAAAEAALEGEDGEEDHDNRKLRKPERMRMLVKNKEEGTELFKGGSYRLAAARYHKALTHSTKFFDLSPEDEKEVAALKLSLYLNLSQCYIKLENWEQVLRNCNDALAIEPTNAKALFRRSTAYEAKKNWDKALEDLKAAAKSAPEDKIIPKSEERIRKQIQKEKDKEKKMWGGVFKS